MVIVAELQLLATNLGSTHNATLPYDRVSRHRRDQGHER